MNSLQKEIGQRLKEIRERIFNEGVKLSAGQFAQLLNSTDDKIRNYEIGRSNIPVELLVKLYHKGINPTYILTGEGSVYAENRSGRNLRERVEGEIPESSNIEKVTKLDTSTMTEEEKIRVFKAVAGDLMKLLEEKD